jgi:mannosyltransferase
MTFDFRRIGGSLQFRTARILTAPGALAASWIASYEAWFVAFATAMGVVLALFRSARPFWFDELFTFYISRLPHIDLVFQAIPADGNPPLNYILVRFCLRLFGETELATRLPSILAFAAAMLATYFFVRRRCGAVPALFGMFALVTSGIAAYGNEARPYAPLLGFTGLTMVSWQAATEKGRARLIPLIGVAVGIAGAITSHHYGVFHVGVPLMFGEAVRLAKRRRFDFPLYCACAVGMSMIAITASFVHETHRVMLNYVRDSVSFWARPSVWSIISYADMVNLWILFSFLALLWLTNSAFKPGDEPGQSARESDSIPAHELAATVGLALLVPIMIGITWIATGYYLTRYAIGAAMGIAILMGIAADRLGRNASHGSAVASLCMVFVLLAFAGPRTIAIIDQFTKSPVASVGPSRNSAHDAAQDKEPIVVASALTYMPMWWYASPPLRERLHYLADLPFAVRQSDFLPELSLVANQPFVPSKVDEYRQFVSVHREFLLYCVGMGRLEWTKERLQREGWTLHLLYRNGQETLFLAQAPDRNVNGGAKCSAVIGGGKVQRLITN